MAWRKINDEKLTAIANAIRERNHSSDSMTINDMPELISTIGIDAVPDYWKSYLDGRATEINSALSAANENKSCFLWYSDAHWTTNYGHSPAILKYMSKNTGIKKTFYGGDISTNKSGEMEVMQQWQARVSEIPNHHSVIGNHDIQVEELPTAAEQVNFFLMSERTGDMAINTGKMYYYIDNHIENTRYICLSTGKMWTNADEVKWCIEVLNATPKNWHIIIISHLWLNNDYTNGGIVTTPVDYTKGYLDMFDAYNYRQSGTESFTSTTYSFTNAGAKIEFIIGGHTHADYDFTTAKGIPVILTESDAWQERSDTSTAKKGTTTENCMYAIIADYGAKQVKAINIGRGLTRSLVIPHISLYTNVIPISTNSDGTIYNGKGYATNTRLSTSSSAPSSGTGWCTTGFIPCQRGDTLRFKNMEMYDISGDGGSTSRTTIITYKSDFTTNGGNWTWSKSSPPTDQWQPVYGDNGDIIQLTLPSSLKSDVAYIRLSCGYIDDESIMTVNEEIE